MHIPFAVLLTVSAIVGFVLCQTSTSPPIDKDEEFYQETLFNDTEDVNLNNTFEGDTILSNRQMYLIHPHTKITWKKGRNGLNLFTSRWPKKTVPFTFAQGHFKKFHKKRILRAMDKIEEKTCVKFRPKKPTDKDFVLIRNGKYCKSHVGYLGQGQQSLMLSVDGCTHLGTVLHELLHTLGFLHMQNHPKRNLYVRIMWNNIQKGGKDNFKRNINVIDFGIPYDFKSIMHYSPTEFSKNGKPTIVSRMKNTTISDNTSLSKGDIAKIRKMYSC